MGKKKTRHMIAARILISIGIPILLIFFTAQFLFLSVLKGPVETMMSENIQAQSSSASFQISEYFTKYMEIVRQMTTNVEYTNVFDETRPGGLVTAAPHFSSAMASLKQVGASDSHIHTAWFGDMDTSKLVQSDGAVHETGWVMQERPFYQAAISSKDIILTEPYQDALTQQWVITILQAVYPDGASAPAGIVCVDIQIDQLSEIMSHYQLGKNGYFILVTPAGQIIHHPNADYINQSISATDIDTTTAEKVIAGQEGVVTYQDNDTEYHGYISKIGTTGWSILSSLPTTEFSQTYHTVTNMINIVFLVFGIIIAVILIVLSQGISRPIRALANVANHIAEGSMEIENIPITKDEIGQVGRALSKTVERLKTYKDYIDEITSTLEKIASGKLNYTLSYDYSGEFSTIKTALLHISEELNATLHPIHTMSENIHQTAAKMSEQSNLLAHNATEENQSIDEISGTVKNISEEVQENARSITKVTENAEKLEDTIQRGNEQMNTMRTAMHEINESAARIGAIIKTIEDIAFQTNILALNAAVEAARAGTAGQGFAVVADEVRSLAGKSGAAAKDTTALIESTVRAIQNGVQLTDDTEATLSTIVDQAREVVATIEKIATATTHQASSIQTVTSHMNQIVTISSDNIGFAEESGSTALSLTQYAQELKKLLEKFE